MIKNSVAKAARKHSTALPYLAIAADTALLSTAFRLDHVEDKLAQLPVRSQ